MRIDRVLTIFRRDFLDAVKDARVLLAIAVPFATGIFYGLTFDDTATQPTAILAYASAGDSRLPQTLQTIAGDAVDIELAQAPNEAAVREAVDDDADLGLVIPAGFDPAVDAGQSPPLTVIQPENPGFASSYLAAALTPALRQMARQEPPATVTVETIGATSDVDIIERVELNRYFVLVAAIMQIATITLYSVPVVLSQEKERRTLDALIMIASHTEVIVAKALFGIAYVAISIPLLLVITGIMPEQPLVFAGAVALVSLALIGLGLIMGITLSAATLTSWGGVIILPAIAPAFATGFSAPGWVEAIIQSLPTGAGARLAINGISSGTLFANQWISWLVLVVWCALSFALLSWIMKRREV